MKDWDMKEFNTMFDQMKDWNWIFGETPKFEHSLETRFDWGIMVHINKFIFNSYFLIFILLGPSFII